MNLGQNGMPAKSMVLVLDNKELWVGCGNKIVIVDTSTLVILDEIAVYQTQRTHVRIMVTDGPRVWSADRRSTKILQWEVSTRQLTHIFDCDVDNPLGVVLCSELMGPRRFADKGGSIDRSRARTISDPTGSVGEPSYTESMFKEAMNRETNQKGHKSLPRDMTSSARADNSDHEDLDSSFSSPATISGSQAKRPLPSESDSVASTDSGVSSFRSTRTTGSTVTSATLDAAQGQDEDSRVDLVVASETSKTVFSEAEATVPFDGSQNMTEQEIKSNEEIYSEDQTSESSSTFPSDESKPSVSDTARIECKSLASEDEDRAKTQQAVDEDNSVITSDDSLKDGDANEVRKQNEANFELVDREETRQAFIEGTRKTVPSTSANTQQCPSMDTLQIRFTSSARAPSLMSSQKRKSQRRQTAEDDSKSPPTTTKPWAGRPRLRVLAGSINRVTSLLLVNGTLWVGRGVGDVLTVNVNPANNDLPLGYVFAQLESDNQLGYENGQVDEIVNSGSNKVVCLRRLESARGSQSNEERFTERYQLVVWEAWGDTEFKRFKDRLDNFNSLVE